MSSRRRESDSSLELLLDTMCNTFGGVMFIAIALIVVVSMLQTAKKAVTDPAPELADVRNIQAQIADARREIAALADGNRQTRELENLLRNDPRRAELAKVAALEAAIPAAKLQTRAAEAARRARELEVRRRRDAADSAQLECRKIEQENARIEAQSKQVILKIADLETRRNTTPVRRMVFSRLAESQDAPYHVLIRNGRFWRVGPERSGLDASAFHSDVSAVREDKSTVCSPRPDRGEPVLDGERISPQLRQCLDSLAANRVCQFSVTPQDAKVFHHLRELLKKERIRHGFELTDSVDQIAFSYQKNVKYEY